MSGVSVLGQEEQGWSNQAQSQCVPLLQGKRETQFIGIVTPLLTVQNPHAFIFLL